MRKSSNAEKSFQLPPVWNNEDEIYRLFVEIKRPRHIDPVGYDHKISFWRDLITSYAKFHRIVVITEQSLSDVFKRRFDSDGVIYRPRCLHQVLSEMMRMGYVKVVDNGSLVSNLLSTGFEWVIRKPISWAWTFINGEEKEELNKRDYDDPDTLLYLADLVTSYCEDFLEEFKLSQDSLIMDGYVYSLDEFDDALKQYFSHATSREFIRNQLIEKGYVRIDSTVSIPLVFVLNDGEATHFDSTTLSSIAHIRRTMKMITQDQERLSAEITVRRQKIKMLVKNNRKNEALSMLRRCKQMEKELERKAQHLTQLEALELRITASKDNRTVLNAISEANTSLKQTTGGLAGLEDAEKAMDELAENIEDQEAISRALASPIDSTLRDINEEELAEELDDLIAAESGEPSPSSKKKEESVNVADFPSLPHHKIGESVGEDELMRALNSLSLDKPELRSKAPE